jgi:undecaprenyl diphosphate synthase
MDGNGRWATARGLSRLAGHERGADAVRRAVEAAPALGIGVLTLFAFSADNFKRPRLEVSGLMALFRRYLETEVPALVREGVRLEVIGRRDRLPGDLVEAMGRAASATARGRALLLRLAVDYSARDAILRAARAFRPAETPTREAFRRRLADAYGADAEAPDVDLLIRTGGEQRLSDFLLWEAAHAELHFTPRLWPDFDAAGLAAAVEDFRRRERRFGALPAAPAIGPVTTPVTDPVAAGSVSPGV